MKNLVAIVRALIGKYEGYIAAGLMAFFFGFGLYIHSVFDAAAENTKFQAEVNKRLKQEKVYAEKSAEYEKTIAELRAAGEQRKKDEKNEIRKNPTYGTCMLAASSVRISNAAIAAANAAAKSN